jgi:hypothetical protein
MLVSKEINDLQYLLWRHNRSTAALQAHKLPPVHREQYLDWKESFTTPRPGHKNHSFYTTLICARNLYVRY